VLLVASGTITEDAVISRCGAVMGGAANDGTVAFPNNGAPLSMRGALWMAGAATSTCGYRRPSRISDTAGTGAAENAMTGGKSMKWRFIIRGESAIFNAITIWGDGAYSKH
jgi:hypothetical protein